MHSYPTLKPFYINRQNKLFHNCSINKFWTLWTFVNSGVYLSAENLCRRNGTVLSQSSTYKGNYAVLAYDGSTMTREEYCALTDVNYSKAWLQVDLGKPYSMSSVKIYFRKEGKIYIYI